MRIAPTLLAGLAAFAGAASAHAQTVVVSPGADRAGVVFYRDRPVSTTELMAAVDRGWVNPSLGLGLIVERRTIEIPAGEATIRLEGLADGAIAETATIDGLPADVVDRNLDYDLLTPGSLLVRSVGQPVTVVRTLPGSGRTESRPAVLRAAAGGPVLEIDGRIEALDCSGLTERIVFDRVPDGLAERPTLTIRTRSPRARRAEISLAYLAGGLMWSADYVARLSDDGETASLTGWLTLANVGRSGFSTAPVQAVAGRFNRDGSTQPVQPSQIDVQPQCWPQDTTTDNDFGIGGGVPPPPPPPPPPAMAPVQEIVVTGSRVSIERLVSTSPLARQQDLGDYKLYSLPEPTDVAPRQTKQVRFLEQPEVRLNTLYRFRLDDRNLTAATSEPEPTERIARTRNREDEGLGLALPGGSVTVYQQVEGRAALVGQARFEDRPIGLPVEWELGEADLVRVRARLQGPDKPDVGRLIGVQLMNARDVPVEIELIPEAQYETGFRLITSSTPSMVADSGLIVFRVTVPASGFAELTYKYRHDD